MILLGMLFTAEALESDQSSKSYLNQPLSAFSYYATQ